MLSSASSSAHLVAPLDNPDPDYRHSDYQHLNFRHTDYRCALTFSRGIKTIKHLSSLLNIEQILTPSQLKKTSHQADCVLVWGRKENTSKAIHFANANSLPVIYLEDGWIRSCSANPHSRQMYSLQMDYSGVYYDSRERCDLEDLLNLPGDAFAAIADEDALAYAAQNRAVLIENSISKYNYCTQLAERVDERPLVLVIDQTKDDASVRFGGMDGNSFDDMLDAAIDENPHAEVVVRTHPDVVAGQRQGYLAAKARRCGIRVTSESSNPIQALKQTEKVYTGTSQMGYEALLCDKPVVVFGQPFYAGWGLADERSSISRRTAKRTIDELFHATHVMQARYCNPINGKAWQLHECLAHVRLQQNMFKRNARHFHCEGITRWKRHYIAQFLRSPDGAVSFEASVNKMNKNVCDVTKVDNDNMARVCKVTWSYRRYDDIPPDQPQQSDGVDVYRLEDGFLRSSGLGSDFSAPSSLVLDSAGLYFDPTRESDLERLLNSYDCNPTEISRAVRLKKLILSSRLSKYNVGRHNSVAREETNVVRVLVVGQVEDDESIRRGCSEISSNVDLLKAVRLARPDAEICYKPHPDVVAGNRRGNVPESLLAALTDRVETEASIIDCLDDADELHTMTSLSGFEALMRGRKVVTYGAPFYSGWGLTEDRQKVQRRVRRRTLDELVYLCMIKYPRYLDVVSGEFVSPEDLVEIIKSQRDMKKQNSNGWVGRQLKKAVNIVRGLRYAP